MSTSDFSGEKQEYRRSYVLVHLRSAGLSDEQIRKWLAQLNTPDKEILIAQYLETVPEDQREEVATQLRGGSH